VPLEAATDLKRLDQQQARLGALMELEQANAELNSREFHPDYFAVFDEEQFAELVAKADRYAEQLNALAGEMTDNQEGSFDADRHAELLAQNDRNNDEFVEALDDRELLWLGSNGFLHADHPMDPDGPQVWRSHRAPVIEASPPEPEEDDMPMLAAAGEAPPEEDDLPVLATAGEAPAPEETVEADPGDGTDEGDDIEPR